ncbi:MAG: FtsX-like permease family protein [Polyangiaceae bacterium]
MSSLGKKLLRDLSRMWGQALTIALVVACGIASFVTMRTAYGSLVVARDAYYDASRFADVFARLVRAPDEVASRIERVPGVAVVDTRIVEPLTMPIEGLEEPARGLLVSLDDVADREARLSALDIRSGRMIAPGRSDEAIVLAAFAEANGIQAGSTLPMLVNGSRRDVRVVGIALSPEYVFAAGAAGDLAADNRRFGIVYMDRRSVAAAFQMEGAFNDVQIALQPHAKAADVISSVDALLERYGGFGAVDRAHQTSEYIVASELRQLESYATVAPLIFLAVAAFLVNMVLSRLVQLQRQQIATLKALGFSAREVATHYLSFVLVIVAVGAAAGVTVGALLGRGMLSLYARYFRFPSFDYHLDLRTVVEGVAVSAIAAIAGALVVLRRVMKLPPAEAMQPEAPPTYRASLLERIGVGRLFGTGGRMILREMTRRPLRLALSSIGISFGIAIVVVAGYMPGAIDVLVDTEFEAAQREDVMVTFSAPRSASAIGELAALPGVMSAEALRVVPVRVRFGSRSRETVLTAHPADASLRRVIEQPLRAVTLPEHGLVVSDALARALGAGVGDELTLEPLEGDRVPRRATIVGTTTEMLGLGVHASMHEVEAMFDQEPLVTSALLRVDPARAAELDARLAALPRVAGVNRPREVARRFQDRSTESMRTTSVILTLFGVTIAIGVVYNNARAALSMRSRDLATLRVLGFTRREITLISFGEIFAQVALAVLPGILIGRAFVVLTMSTVDQELIRFPTVITSGAYAFAVAVTLGAALVSALLMKRRLDELDLVGVLKARD